MIFEILAQVSWRPGVGDPTILAWIACFAYLAVAVLALVVATYHCHHSRRLRWFWWIVFAITLGLGFNKQLDLQSLLLELGGLVAKELGVYENRRMLQRVFVMGLLLAGTVSLGIGFKLFRRRFSQIKLAVAGVMLLGGFVVLRAIQFNHAGFHVHNRLLDSAYFMLSLELFGVFLVGLNTLMFLYVSPKTSKVAST